MIRFRVTDTHQRIGIIFCDCCGLEQTQTAIGWARIGPEVDRRDYCPECAIATGHSRQAVAAANQIRWQAESIVRQTERMIEKLQRQIEAQKRLATAAQEFVNSVDLPEDEKDAAIRRAKNKLGIEFGNGQWSTLPGGGKDVEM